MAAPLPSSGRAWRRSARLLPSSSEGPCTAGKAVQRVEVPTPCGPCAACKRCMCGEARERPRAWSCLMRKMQGNRPRPCMPCSLDCFMRMLHANASLPMPSGHAPTANMCCIVVSAKGTAPPSGTPSAGDCGGTHLGRCLGPGWPRPPRDDPWQLCPPRAGRYFQYTFTVRRRARVDCQRGPQVARRRGRLRFVAARRRAVGQERRAALIQPQLSWGRVLLQGMAGDVRDEALARACWQHAADFTCARIFDVPSWMMWADAVRRACDS